MSQEANKAAVRSFFQSIDSVQSMAPIDEVAAPNYTAYFTGAPVLDREGMKGFGNGFFAACPGLSHTVEDIVAEGDMVAARLTIRGQQTRPLAMPGGSLPPSDKQFAITALNVYRFADGKISEHWSQFDMLGFLQQIGAGPK